jgi:hypothetical protein
MVPEAAGVFQGWHILPAYRAWCFHWLLCGQLKAATRFAIMSVQCGHLGNSKPSSGVLLIKLVASAMTFLLICHYLPTFRLRLARRWACQALTWRKLQRSAGCRRSSASWLAG